MKSLYEQLRDAAEDIKAQDPVVWDDVDNLKWKEDSVLAEKLNEALKKDPGIGPIMGGLITDPTPGRVRRLEERVAKLEAMLDKMDKLQWMIEEIEGGRL